jgi:adenylate cyclase
LIIDRTQNAQVILLLLACSLAVAHICFWLLPGVFEPWNAKTIDSLFSLRSGIERLRPTYDDTVVHVDINNTSIRKLNNFYLDRSYHAHLIRNLAEMNVAMQLYDLIFAARSQEAEDTALIDATETAGNVYFGLAFELSRKGESRKTGAGNEADAHYLENTQWHIVVEEDPSSFYAGVNPLITFPALASASKGLGYLTLKFDRDGVFRRLPLLVRYNGAFYPSFSFRAICDYLDVPPGKITVRPGETVTLKGATRPGEGKAHDIAIPIDKYGNMIVNFIGPWGSMKHYDFADVLRASEDRDEMEMWQDELTGKIVVVSEVMTGSSDVGPVPTDTNLPLPGLHANTIHTILTESFLRELSGTEMLLIELLLLIIVLFLSLRFSSLPFSLGTIALGGCYLVIGALLFFYGGLIAQIIRPLLAVTLCLISTLAYRYVVEEKDKEVLRATFESYFPPSVVKKIMTSPKNITSGGQKKELTVLFSDIKDFTRYTATMPPDRIQILLNEYFEAMTEIVFRFNGTVDKFMGDGLMVFFGDPDPQPDHALRCVHAAIEMQHKARELRVTWEKQGAMPLQIRIGINTGTVVVGNMGSTRRLSYTVLGSAVNLAQRLESSAPVGGILISQRTYELVKDQVSARPLGKIQVKGLDEGIDAYEIGLNEKLA